MNKYRHFLSSVFLITLMAVSVAALPAAAQGRFKAARGRAGQARMSGIQNYVRGLNLTADQKAQIKNILQSNKAQRLQARRDVVKARLDLMQGVPNAAAELANAQLQAANLRKEIVEKIKPVLTADQIAKVQERRQRREQRLQNMLDRLNSRISG